MCRAKRWLEVSSRREISAYCLLLSEIFLTAIASLMVAIVTIQFRRTYYYMHHFQNGDFWLSSLFKQKALFYEYSRATCFVTEKKMV